MKKLKTFLSFKAFLVYSLIAFLILCYVSMNKLEDYLTEYEKYQPTSITEQVLSYFENSDYDSLYQITPRGEQFDEDTFPRYFDKVIDKDSLFTYKSATTDTSLVYDYISNNKKIATLTLEKSENTNKYGFDEYKIADIEWHKLFSYTITAPSDSTIYVNSKPLELEGESSIYCNEYESFDDNVFSMTTYNIDYLEYIYEIEAKSEHSAEILMSLDENGNYVFSYQTPNDMIEEISARATEAVKAYVVFSTKSSAPVSNVLPYIHVNAPLYKHLQMFDNTWNDIYTKSEYEKFSLTDFTYYNDTKASCRATALYKIYPAWQNPRTFDFDFILYFTKENESWYITSMERVNENNE